MATAGWTCHRGNAAEAIAAAGGALRSAVRNAEKSRVCFAALATAVADRPRALSLLGAAYSANAYAWATRYQNCNQWVAEMLALAWASPLTEQSPADPSHPVASARERAQHWLQAQAYAPTVISVANPLLVLASTLFPWVHRGDHPAEDLARQVFQVSMPASIDAFVQQRHPQARRIEFCHTDHHVVVRHGWVPLPEDCQPGPGDEVLLFDAPAPAGARAAQQVL